MANHPFQGSDPIPLWPWGIVGLITVPLAVAGPHRIRSYQRIRGLRRRRLVRDGHTGALLRWPSLRPDQAWAPRVCVPAVLESAALHRAVCPDPGTSRGPLAVGWRLRRERVARAPYPLAAGRSRWSAPVASGSTRLAACAERISLGKCQCNRLCVAGIGVAFSASRGLVDWPRSRPKARPNHRSGMADRKAGLAKCRDCRGHLPRGNVGRCCAERP